MSPGTQRSPSAGWQDYLFALVAVAAALGLRYLLNPILGQQGPYLILTLAIVVAALRGGAGPALFATLLATTAGTYLFIGAGLDELLKPENLGRTVLFVAIGTSIGLIGGRLRKSQQALAATVRKLGSSNRAKDNALAVLAHEIRNPLSALRSAGELLGRAPDERRKVLWASDLIGRQVTQMARMADDLLDTSVVMRGEVAMERQRVDLRSVLQTALEQSGALIRRKRHHLRTDLGSGPAEVLGDANRLVQVFANLLNNAAKYTPAGGELVLELRKADARHLQVSVRDNGVGMASEDIAELFEPFVQAPAAADNPETGLGLGLAIVKKLVELHGGQVKAESAGPNRGSTFTVQLPLAP